MARFIPIIVLLIIVTGCGYSARHRLDMVHGPIDKALSSDWEDMAVAKEVRSGLTRHGQFYVLQLDRAQRLRAHNASKGSYAWLATDSTDEIAILLLVEGDRASDQVVAQHKGWVPDPAPLRIEKLNRKLNAQIETLVPAATPWSRGYFLFYANPISSLVLSGNGHTVSLQFP